MESAHNLGVVVNKHEEHVGEIRSVSSWNIKDELNAIVYSSTKTTRLNRNKDFPPKKINKHFHFYYYNTEKDSK